MYVEKKQINNSRNMKFNLSSKVIHNFFNFQQSVFYNLVSMLFQNSYVTRPFFNALLFLGKNIIV